MAEPIKVVVCDDCQRALFVNGHPRNFCGHGGRGTLTEFVPKQGEVLAYIDGDGRHWAPEDVTVVRAS